MSEAIPISENQGGDSGGIDVPRDTSRYRVNSNHLTRSELRYLARAARRAEIPPEQSADAVRMVSQALHVGLTDDTRARVGLAAVDAHLALLASNRAEELHALEVEERLRALESDKAAAPQAPGVTFAGPVQINSIQSATASSNGTVVAASSSADSEIQRMIAMATGAFAETAMRAQIYHHKGDTAQ